MTIIQAFRKARKSEGRLAARWVGSDDPRWYWMWDPQQGDWSTVLCMSEGASCEFCPDPERDCDVPPRRILDEWETVPAKEDA